MNFFDDPKRAQIEPMHEFLTTWARWGRMRPIYQESMTYKIMMWIRDHSKRVEEIHEGIVTGQPIHMRDDDSEIIAWKVEDCLHKMRTDCKHRERNILLKYYRDSRNGEPIGAIARRLGCKPWKVEDNVKEALVVFSSYWRD